eukprot:UN19239
MDRRRIKRRKHPIHPTPVTSSDITHRPAPASYRIVSTLRAPVPRPGENQVSSSVTTR